MADVPPIADLAINNDNECSAEFDAAEMRPLAFTGAVAVVHVIRFDAAANAIA